MGKGSKTPLMRRKERRNKKIARVRRQLAEAKDNGKRSRIG